MGPKSSNRALLTMTRSIQKFFAHQMLASSSDTMTPKDGHVENTMDVGAVLHDVDEILDHRSLEEGRLLLRGMVADLLKEMDVLRYQYDALQAQFQNVKEERDLVNHIYNDKIETLTLTLQTAIQQQQQPSTGSRHPNTGITNPTATTTDSSLLSTELKQHMEQGNIVSADVATTLTIQTLLQKVESLHLVTLQQQDTIVQCQEQMEDLKSDNEAKTYKIMALEQQFTHINHKRTKVLTKFGSGGPKATQPSLMLRPMRLPPQIVPVATTKTVTQRDDEEEEVVFHKTDDDRDDFNSTYQDHKDNIIANIMLNPPPHRAPPNDHPPEVATPDVVEPDEEATIIKNPEETLASPLEQPPNVVVATLDMPDDEAHDKENMVAPTVASPFAALLQQQTAPPAGVMVTPPPATRSTKQINKNTTTILGHHSNNTVEVTRPFSRKNPSEMGRTKQRHGPRAPRLVQLMEQV